MGLVYADIELINNDDLAMVRRNMIDKDEVRHMHVNMLADSGAYMMAINENIQAIMDFPFIERRRSYLADNTPIEFDVVGPIMVKFENRTAVCSANVLPGDSEPLLGAIPMEEMDVLIHPLRQELIVNPEHPYGAILKMKGYR